MTASCGSGRRRAWRGCLEGGASRMPRSIKPETLTSQRALQSELNQVCPLGDHHPHNWEASTTNSNILVLSYQENSNSSPPIPLLNKTKTSSCQAGLLKPLFSPDFKFVHVLLLEVKVGLAAVAAGSGHLDTDGGTEGQTSHCPPNKPCSVRTLCPHSPRKNRGKNPGTCLKASLPGAGV